jgi:tetratricopeptide (TPR) repeat protein
MANNKNAALGQCARKCLAAAFLIGLPMLTASASEDVGSWCEQQWIVQSAEFTDRDNPDYNGLLQRWMQNEGKCKGTVLYEARLALIYSQLDQPAKSKEVLLPIEKQNSKFTYLVRLVDILADTKTLMLTHKMDSTHLEQTDQRFRDYVNRYPDKPEGYAYLAAVEMQLRRYDAAVKLLENVVAKSGRTAQTRGLYRNLTIS